MFPFGVWSALAMIHPSVRGFGHCGLRTNIFTNGFITGNMPCHGAARLPRQLTTFTFWKCWANLCIGLIFPWQLVLTVYNDIVKGSPIHCIELTWLYWNHIFQSDTIFRLIINHFLHFHSMMAMLFYCKSNQQCREAVVVCHSADILVQSCHLN